MTPLRGRSCPCPDCDTGPGHPHMDGCDVARCTECGWQRISCDRNGSDLGWGQEWTGVWPGETECEEYGLWCLDQVADGFGFVPCPPGAPGAIHDLNWLYKQALDGKLVWDRARQRWIVTTYTTLEQP